jgi:hypothetical protein
METNTMPVYKKNDFYVPSNRQDMIAALYLMFPEGKRESFLDMPMDQLKAIYLRKRNSR